MTIAGSKQFLEVDLQADVQWGPQTASPIENNIFPAGETAFGTLNGSPNWLGVPIVEDGFGISPTAQRAGENLKRNVAAQAPPNLTGFDVSGALNPVAAPFDKSTAYNRSVCAWLLGASINKQAEKLRSYSMRWMTPNVASQTFTGCKVQSLTIEATEDSGTLSFNSEWVSASMAAAALGTPTTPIFPTVGNQDAASGEGLNAQGWVFSRAIIYKAAQLAAQDLTVMTPIATARSLSITMNNNLSPKSARVKTQLTGSPSCPLDTFVVTDIREGQQEISGTMVIDYVDETEWTALTSDTILTIGIIARHPQSKVFGVTALSEAAPFSDADFSGAPLTIDLDETAGGWCDSPGAAANNDYLLAAGGAIMLEHQPAGASVINFEQDIYSIATGYETAGDTITCDDRAYWKSMSTIFSDATVTNFLVYDTTVGVRVSGVKLDSANLTGGPADIIGQELNFTAGQFGSEAAAMTWITPHFA